MINIPAWSTLNEGRFLVVKINSKPSSSRKFSPYFDEKNTYVEIDKFAPYFPK